mgnify:CR=1 FL=1
MAGTHSHQMFAHSADGLGAGRIHHVGQIGQGGAAVQDIVIAAAALAGGGQHFQEAAGVPVERHAYLPSI